MVHAVNCKYRGIDMLVYRSSQCWPEGSLREDHRSYHINKTIIERPNLVHGIRHRVDHSPHTKTGLLLLSLFEDIS